jgi:hypothetical protein
LLELRAAGRQTGGARNSAETSKHAMTDDLLRLSNIDKRFAGVPAV